MRTPMRLAPISACGCALVYMSGASAFTYRIVDLSAASGDSTDGFSALNSVGQLTGTLDVGGTGRAFRYQDGTLMYVTAPGVNSFGVAINSSGQVAGYGVLASGDPKPHAFLTNGSGVTDLGVLPGGTGSFAAAVNDSGAVTGAAYTTNGASPNDDYYLHAFMYSGGALVDLGTLTPQGYSYGMGINNAGQVVGYASVPGQLRPLDHAFLYANGVMTDLHPTQTTVVQGPSSSQAFSINDAGQIAGTVTQNGHGMAAIYTNGAWTTLDALDRLNTRGTVAMGLWINNHGQMVGNTSTNEGAQAFIYSNGTAQILGTMVDFTSGPAFTLAISAAAAINDSGVILAAAGLSNGYRPVLLIPQELTVSTDGSVINGIAGETSYPHTVVTITNTGTVAVPISNPTSTDPQFMPATTCGASLAPGGTCTLSVQFAPTQLFEIYATLAFDIDGHAHQVFLQGLADFQATLTVSPLSVPVNQPVTLTWTNFNGVVCSLSGDGAGDGWTGTVSGSGSTTTTERAPGQYTYNMQCNDGRQTHGISAAAIFTPAKSGGGGELDLLTLGVLAGLGAAGVSGRMRQLRHRTA